MSKLTLLDSLQKRCLFLKHVVGELGLKEVNVIHGRAEEKGQDKKYREKFDGAMARAVTQLPVLAEYCLPLVRVGGLFISFKGPGVKEEIAAAEEAVFLLGGRFKKVEFYQLPVLGDQRSLVVIEKVAVSPEKYPRRPGVPEKKPLV
jgi:16S rRNA (guanine527-N7)-methyltransferase